MEDILVHKKHRRMFAEASQKKVCRKCVICKHFHNQDEVISPDGRAFTFQTGIGCKSTNIIYGNHCAKCDKVVYIGETGVTVYERFQNHLSTIRNKKMYEPVPKHFNSKDHTIEDVKIVGVEQIKRKDIHLRKVRESFWIKKMGTLQPNGLNQNAGISDTFRI